MATQGTALTGCARTLAESVVATDALRAALERAALNGQRLLRLGGRSGPSEYQSNEPSPAAGRNRRMPSQRPK